MSQAYKASFLGMENTKNIFVHIYIYNEGTKLQELWKNPGKKNIKRPSKSEKHVAAYLGNKKRMASNSEGERTQPETQQTK